ncbi:hypothetical protein ABZ313_19850 [Streptomyces sp. NPDC006251]|uniref:hypothetical protein n=1 Tax=Streptomyces sp. NPDC006251 TaxID=3155718 RepID=UPI0033AE4B4F
MPATALNDPLRVECVFPDGPHATCLLRDESFPEFSQMLMRALADLVHPHGPLNTASSVREYLASLRHFLPQLQAVGFDGTVQWLTRPRLAECLLGIKLARHEHHIRAILRRLDELEGAFAPDVRHFVNGHPFKTRPARLRKSLPAYNEAEWQRLREVCEAGVAASYAVFRQAREESERGQDWRTGGLSRENIQFTLRHQGPENVGFGRKYIGVTRYDAEVRPLYAGGVYEAVAALYPSTVTVFDYQVLFGMRTGIVPDGIAELGLGDIDWAGDTTVLLDYMKGRTATESLTLSRKATRLLEQWLDHSSISRRFMPEAFKDQLWSRYSVTGPARWTTDEIDPYTRGIWAKQRGLVDEDGKPWQIHVHRIRTTFEASQDRRLWQGSSRATIDPNHTPAVEGDHYVAGQTPTQKDATETVIESGQTDLLRRARPQVIADGDDLADLVGKFPELVEQLRLDDAALAELIGGERDVFAAGCADQLSGLHGPKGRPCPARPWVCLLCPLALFAPRHVGNLMRLRAFFGRQWRQMTSGAFMAVFGPYAQRLDALLTLTYFSEAVLREAAAEVSDADEELPLHPEELTA